MNGQLGEPSSLTRIIRSFRKYSRASRYVMAGTRGSLSLWGGEEGMCRVHPKRVQQLRAGRAILSRES